MTTQQQTNGNRLNEKWNTYSKIALVRRRRSFLGCASSGDQKIANSMVISLLCSWKRHLTLFLWWGTQSETKCRFSCESTWFAKKKTKQCFVTVQFVCESFYFILQLFDLLLDRFSSIIVFFHLPVIIWHTCFFFLFIRFLSFIFESFLFANAVSLSSDAFVWMLNMIGGLRGGVKWEL